MTKNDRTPTGARRWPGQRDEGRVVITFTKHTCHPQDRAERQYDADCARCTEIVERRKGVR